MPDFPPDLVRGSITPVILSLLRDRPMYGYEMVKQVNARSNGQLDWKEGTLYPALHRLESEGLVKPDWRPSPPNTPGPRTRKYYSLTPAGHRELAKRATEWKTFTTIVSSLITP